jgi:hypothetical protein
MHNLAPGGFVVESAFMNWEKDVADRGRIVWYTV